MTHTILPASLRKKRTRRIGNAAKICCTCLALLLLFLGSGCISVDCGYSPNVALEQNALSTPQRFPIIYSVSLDIFRTDILFAPTLKSLREKVRLALTHSGLFESVTYVPEVKRDAYHIAFRFFSAHKMKPTTSRSALSADIPFVSSPLGKKPHSMAMPLFTCAENRFMPLERQKSNALSSGFPSPPSAFSGIMR